MTLALSFSVYRKCSMPKSRQANSKRPSWRTIRTSIGRAECSTSAARNTSCSATRHHSIVFVASQRRDWRAESHQARDGNDRIVPDRVRPRASLHRAPRCPAGEVRFAKALNGSVAGSINELVLLAKYDLGYGRSLHGISKRLIQFPMSGLSEHGSGGYGLPGNVFGQFG